MLQCLEYKLYIWISKGNLEAKILKINCLCRFFLCLNKLKLALQSELVFIALKCKKKETKLSIINCFDVSHIDHFEHSTSITSFSQSV